jgi:hypothetical protein
MRRFAKIPVKRVQVAPTRCSIFSFIYSIPGLFYNNNIIYYDEIDIGRIPVFAGDHLLTAFRRPAGLHAFHFCLHDANARHCIIAFVTTCTIPRPAAVRIHVALDQTRHEFTVPIFLHVFTIRFASVRRCCQSNSFCRF